MTDDDPASSGGGLGVEESAAGAYGAAVLRTINSTDGFIATGRKVTPG